MPPEFAHFPSAQRMRGRRAVLGPTDVQGSGFEFDLLPMQDRHLAAPGSCAEPS
jgi:hypothetical protein